MNTREIIDDRLWRIHQHASALRAIGEIALGNGSNQNDSLSNLNPDHFLHLMELLASGLEGAKNDLEHALNQPALRAA